MKKTLLVALTILSGCAHGVTTSYSPASGSYETQVELGVDLAGMVEGDVRLMPTRRDSAGTASFMIELRGTALRDSFGAPPALEIGLGEETLELAPRDADPCAGDAPRCEDLVEGVLYDATPADLARIAASESAALTLRGPRRVMDGLLETSALCDLRDFVRTYVTDDDGNVPAMRIQMACPASGRDCTYWLVPDEKRSS